MKQTVLCFVFDKKSDALLMIHKKRGQGAGKWNVPGGKIQEGEIPIAAAIRETLEETGIRPLDLQEAGKLEFFFPAGNSWDNTCTVFRTQSYSGALLSETEECRAQWVPLAQIPYEQMWDSDRLWVPLLLCGKPFHRAYRFDAADRLLEEKDLEQLQKSPGLLDQDDTLR